MTASLQRAAAALLFVLCLGVFVGGCASTSPTAPSDTTPPAPAPRLEVPIPEPDTFAITPERPPHAWFHMDAEADGYPGLSTYRAHTTLLADRGPERTVTVAIIDSGVDTEHDELAPQIWRNEGEVADTGADDDGNGYVDDLHGWNFLGNADGENVDADTYEVTRLYRTYSDWVSSTDTTDLSAAGRDSLDYYYRIQADFYSDRDEAQQRLQNVRQAHETVQQVLRYVRNYLDVEEVTPADVARLEDADDPGAQQSFEILTFFYDQGLTPNDIKDFYDRITTQVEYGYNPDFDPRPIVGDDYNDLSERYYGNSDVHGPDPGHGTHVAGIVGAARDTTLRIDGVAPAVRLMPIRAVPDGDEHDKDVANAIRYAADNGADIINMSFGKGYSPQKHAVDAAVRYADSLGVLMVHAAGNSASDNDEGDNFPTPFYEDGDRATHWIEVGASGWTMDEELVASFSNYGATTVDVFAPGADIYSATTGNAYRFNSGTSMAAPMVSGVAALLMSYYPSLSAEDVRAIILESAVSYADHEVTLPNDNPDMPGTQVQFGSLSVTGGIVNAYRAVQMASERVDQP
ncbi:MAG: S8 family peptidase [Longimonas sp.]|uniref:S8 family peptidase n=1 Tax=Longimonas sp. TaxID=2039626 RepID=UPI00334991E3